MQGFFEIPVLATVSARGASGSATLVMKRRPGPFPPATAAGNGPESRLPQESKLRMAKSGGGIALEWALV
jgi:hypothetical protein